MARTPASQKHPLLNAATTSLTLGVIALVLRIIDVAQSMSMNPMASPLLLFLNTSNGVGGTDMGRLVPLWGTLLIPVGLVLLAIYLLAVRPRLRARGAQQHQQAWQQAGQEAGQHWQGQQPGQQWQGQQPEHQGQQWPTQQGQPPQQQPQPEQPQP